MLRLSESTNFIIAKFPQSVYYGKTFIAEQFRTKDITRKSKNILHRWTEMVKNFNSLQQDILNISGRPIPEFRVYIIHFSAKVPLTADFPFQPNLPVFFQNLLVYALFPHFYALFPYSFVPFPLQSEFRFLSRFLSQFPFSSLRMSSSSSFWLYSNMLISITSARFFSRNSLRIPS